MNFDLLNNSLQSPLRFAPPGDEVCDENAQGIGKEICPEETLSENEVSQGGGAQVGEPRPGEELGELVEVGGEERQKGYLAQFPVGEQDSPAAEDHDCPQGIPCAGWHDRHFSGEEPQRYDEEEHCGVADSSGRKKAGACDLPL